LHTACPLLPCRRSSQPLPSRRRQKVCVSVMPPLPQNSSARGAERGTERGPESERGEGRRASHGERAERRREQEGGQGRTRGGGEEQRLRAARFLAARASASPARGAQERPGPGRARSEIPEKRSGLGTLAAPPGKQRRLPALDSLGAITVEQPQQPEEKDKSRKKRSRSGRGSRRSRRKRKRTGRMTGRR